MKSGETFEDTLIREVKEETGLTIESVSLHSIQSGYKYRIQVILTANAPLQDSPHTKSIEVYTYSFFAINELPDSLLPEHRTILNTLQSRDGSRDA